MSLFLTEVVTAPAHLPVTVAAADQALAAAVVEEIERGVLWRAIVRQERRILIDGPLPPRIEIEPVSRAVVSLTRWTPGDAAKRHTRSQLRLRFTRPVRRNHRADAR